MSGDNFLNDTSISKNNFNPKAKRSFSGLISMFCLTIGKLEDLHRINKTIPTIEYLHKKGAKVVLISHLSTGKKWLAFFCCGLFKQQSVFSSKIYKRKKY